MPASRSPRAGLLPLLGIPLLAACAATVPVPSVRPGPVPVGAARHLVILDGSGRPDARETVFLELARQTRRDRWFTVDDLSADGHRVLLTERGVRVHPRYPLEEESAGLRIDVRRWQVARRRPAGGRADPQGPTAAETRDTVEGHVVLAVTLFDAWDRALLAAREYEGVAAGPAGETDRGRVLERAASAAVARLLADVTPRTVVESVRLDDGDADQRKILEIAREGDTTRAAGRLQAYAERHPDNHVAAYNLAVLLDSLGERREALAWYDRALELRYRDLYADARAACVRRIEDSEALQPYTPPAALAR